MSDANRSINDYGYPCKHCGNRSSTRHVSRLAIRPSICTRPDDPCANCKRIFGIRGWPTKSSQEHAAVDHDSVEPGVSDARYMIEKDWTQYMWLLEYVAPEDICGYIPISRERETIIHNHWEWHKWVHFTDLHDLRAVKSWFEALCERQFCGHTPSANAWQTILHRHWYIYERAIKEMPAEKAYQLLLSSGVEQAFTEVYCTGAKVSDDLYQRYASAAVLGDEAGGPYVSIQCIDCNRIGDAAFIHLAARLLKTRPSAEADLRFNRTILPETLQKCLEATQ